MTFRDTDLIAFLELGPATLREITEWARQPQDLVWRALMGLQRKHAVRRIKGNRWTLPGMEDADDGEDPVSQDLRDRILASLTGGPARAQSLSKFLGLAASTLLRELNRLEQAQAIERQGGGRSTVWRLPAPEPQTPPPALRQAAPVKASESWWTRHAAPDSRDAFMQEAHAIDEQRSRNDPQWRRPPSVQLESHFQTAQPKPHRF